MDAAKAGGTWQATTPDLSVTWCTQWREGETILDTIREMETGYETGRRRRRDGDGDGDETETGTETRGNQA